MMSIVFYFALLLRLLVSVKYKFEIFLVLKLLNGRLLVGTWSLGGWLIGGFTETYY